MKKISLLLFCLVSFQLAAQVKLVSSNKEDTKVLADSLISNAKRCYIFFEEKEKGEYNYQLVYKSTENTESTDDRLTVIFRIRHIGADKNLEIEGTPEYHFNYVDGRFLDIFPFWFKFIDSSISQEDILKKKSHYIIHDNKRYLLQNRNDVWSISVHDVIK